MNDDRELLHLKGYLKNFAESYLEKSRHGSFCCPCCGSGTGPHKSGALSLYGEKREKWRCFACGEGGDLFDLIGKVRGTDTAQSFQIAKELYGNGGTVSVARTHHTPSTHKVHNVQHTHNAQDTQEVHADFTAYISDCRSALAQNQKAKDYLLGRGISEATADLAMLGYDRSRDAIVIPYDQQGSYYTRRAIDRKEYRKPSSAEAGAQPLYRRDALYNAEGEPIFVVEGEIDAISIMEAGGYAVALCGAKNGRKLLQEIETKAPAGVIVLSLDNDEAGEEATGEIAAELDRVGAVYLRANISGEYKDANEALVADRQTFIETVRSTAENAKAKSEQDEARELEEYRNKSAKAFISGFIGSIAASVDTAYIPTGYTVLDDVLDGGLFEGLYILGAISSLGKTTFCMQMADQIAAAGTDVMIFSLEMALSEIMAKSISRESFLLSMLHTGTERLAKTTRGITTGKRWEHYSKEEAKTILDAIRCYEEYAVNLYIMEGVGDIGVREIRQAVEEHIRITRQKPVVIVDYLQILSPYDPRSTDKQNMDKAVLELKRLSRDFKIPVIAISSLNRQSYGSKISMEAFKESGAIEYSSDVLIGLQARGTGEAGFDVNEAKQREPREIEMKILKNRSGRTGDTLAFDYYPMFNLFKQIQTDSTQIKQLREVR